MTSVDRMAGANIPSLAAMEQTRMLAHTLAQNSNPKFQVSIMRLKFFPMPHSLSLTLVAFWWVGVNLWVINS